MTWCLPITDELVGLYGAGTVHRRADGVRLDRFPPGTAGRVAAGEWELANLRSAAGCAVLLRTDSPWVELEVAGLRHHQPTGSAFVLEEDGGPAGRRVLATVDGRGATGHQRLRFAAGPAAAPRPLWLWLPPISSCVLVSVGLAEGSSLSPAAAPPPRWLAIGDSLTQGFAVASYAETWVHRCQCALGLPARNRGLGGALVEPAVFLPPPAEGPYELVTVALGGNHAWRDAWLDDLAVRCRELADGLLAGGHHRLAWLLPTTKPCEGGAGPATFAGRPLDARLARAAGRVREVIRAALTDYRGRIAVVDELLPPDPGLQPDGLHPAARGHRIYAERLIARLSTGDCQARGKA